MVDVVTTANFVFVQYYRESYRDLIDAADTIGVMKSSSML
ncbi:unnamed protein product, partial [Allacma fusca]